MMMTQNHFFFFLCWTCLYHYVYRKYQKELTSKPSYWPWLVKGLCRMCLSKVWSYLHLYQPAVCQSWCFIEQIDLIDTVSCFATSPHLASTWWMDGWMSPHLTNMMDGWMSWCHHLQASTSEGTTAPRLPSRMDPSKLLWSKYYYCCYYCYSSWWDTVGYGNVMILT